MKHQKLCENDSQQNRTQYNTIQYNTTHYSTAQQKQTQKMNDVIHDKYNVFDKAALFSYWIVTFLTPSRPFVIYFSGSWISKMTMDIGNFFYFSRRKLDDFFEWETYWDTEKDAIIWKLDLSELADFDWIQRTNHSTNKHQVFNTICWIWHC